MYLKTPNVTGSEKFFALSKTFFSQEYRRISRKNGAAQREKDPLSGGVGGFQIHPMESPDLTRLQLVFASPPLFRREHCSQHQIDESVLDSLIIDELRNTKALYQQNWDALEQLIAQWTPKAELTGAQIVKLEKKIRCLEDETEAILMERIRDRANAERYDRMIQKARGRNRCGKKADRRTAKHLRRPAESANEAQTGYQHDRRYPSEGAMTEAHLRMLVEKIYVQETDGKLNLDIQIKAPFRTHLDVYENGTLTERYGALDFDWDRLAQLLYDDGLAG